MDIVWLLFINIFKFQMFSSQFVDGKMDRTTVQRQYINAIEAQVNGLEGGDYPERFTMMVCVSSRHGHHKG